MNLPIPRRGAGVAVLASLAMLTWASPALATDVDIDEDTQAPSQLEITDDDNDRDVVTVSIVGPNVIVVDTGPGGAVPGSDCTALNAQTVSCPLDPPDDPLPADPFLPIGEVDFEGDLGDDEFRMNALLRGDDLEGDEGNDLVIGNELDDELEGGPGNDQLIALGGDDELDGEDDNDSLAGGEGDDDLDGGNFDSTLDGTDVLDGGPGADGGEYGGRDEAVNVSLDDVANDGLPGENDNLVAVESVFTGEGADTLTGNDAANELDGSSGNDTIRGFGGSDSIEGNDGDDLLVGGPAADEVFCEDGIDTAVVDAEDLFGLDCERTGALLGTLDTVNVKKGIAKVPVTCPAAEAAACKGKVKLLLNGKSLGKGKFKVPAGKTKKAKVKLSKKGKKTLGKFGGLALVTAQVATKLAGETSTKESDLLLG